MRTGRARGTGAGRGTRARRAIATVLAMLAAGPVLVPPRTAHAAAPAAGTWLTQDHGGVVRIAPCGQDLCGVLVGLRDQGADGNPQTGVGGAQLCGYPLIEHMTPGGDGYWRGIIVNPRDGRRYSAQMHVDEQGQLALRGYIGVPLFGSTQTWTRYRGTIGPGCAMR
jgi:uncharacterized protein (DUF2147 family)